MHEKTFFFHGTWNQVIVWWRRSLLLLVLLSSQGGVLHRVSTQSHNVSFMIFFAKILISNPRLSCNCEQFKFSMYCSRIMCGVHIEQGYKIALTPSIFYILKFWLSVGYWASFYYFKRSHRMKLWINFYLKMYTIHYTVTSIQHF